MDRLRHVANLWNWLPAFRVVAEYESIQKAAGVLNVSASALSRTVRLLEEAAGELLFVRSAPGLTLTRFGVELLEATRDAMRRIDDVVARDDPKREDMRAFVAASNSPTLTRLLERGLCTIVGGFERTAYRTTSVDGDDAVAELLRGNLDFALVERVPDSEWLATISHEYVGELTFAVFAPESHAMANESGYGSSASAAEVAAAPLVTVASDSASDRTLNVLASVASLEGVETLAQRGPFLALLPTALASRGFRQVAPSTRQLGIVALYRKPLEGGSFAIVGALLQAIRAVLVSSSPFGVPPDGLEGG